MYIIYTLYYIIYYITYYYTTIPCGFWSSAPVHSSLSYFWRDMSSSPLLNSLNNLTYHLSVYFRRPLELTAVGLHSVIFLTVFVSFILFRCPHHFILCALVYLTIFSPLINFSNSSLFPILHPSSVSTAPYVLLNICISNTNKLFTSRNDNVQVSQPQVTIGVISVMYNLF